MPHADGMPANRQSIVNVIDFRRQRLILEWNAAGGTWTACDDPPALVHGVAFIRAAPPNICIFGREGLLHLQVGPEQFTLSENSPRIRCTHGFMSFGLRKRFTVESSTGGVLFSHSFWSGQGSDGSRCAPRTRNGAPPAAGNGRRAWRPPCCARASRLFRNPPAKTRVSVSTGPSVPHRTNRRHTRPDRRIAPSPMSPDSTAPHRPIRT